MQQSDKKGKRKEHLLDLLRQKENMQIGQLD
jgi:hypothetical protein